MIQRDGNTIYELNAQGAMHWFADVQAGHEASGVRTSPEALEKIAVKLSAVDELYAALGDLLYYAEDCSPRHYAMAVDNAEKALAKARGES